MFPLLIRPEALTGSGRLYRKRAKQSQPELVRHLSVEANFHIAAAGTKPRNEANPYKNTQVFD